MNGRVEVTLIRAARRQAEETERQGTCGICLGTNGGRWKKTGGVKYLDLEGKNIEPERILKMYP